MPSNKTPAFVSIGKQTDKINVLLSYRIVELFSEGLYSSPNKAIEELVANSFDAGALRVHVMLPPNLHDQDASIVVIDDGDGMDADGLKEHWLIGVSNKGSNSRLPRGRNPIGKFGIGKLATYVLANRLTHITRRGQKFYSTSMDFELMDKRFDRSVEPKKPIEIPLRQLSEKQAQKALESWTNTAMFKSSNLRLFGRGSARNWTVAIMSALKDKVHEIQPGMLDWILRTALPLRDDFEIWLSGKQLQSSKMSKGRIQRWVLGKDLVELPKPGPDSLNVTIDKDCDPKDLKRFGLIHPDLGRITGYAEAYRDLLTGTKSEQIGRSHGFFVYVRDRLINVADGHFGISPDELRHGTFGRFRLVIHVDGLDGELRSNRETLRDGPLLSTAQNMLRAIFNFVRKTIETHDAAEAPGARLARRLASSPASVSRRPVLEVARAVLEGTFKSRYIVVPHVKDANERADVLSRIESRIESPDRFVTDLHIGYESSADDGLALYEADSGVLRINGMHPFVGAFYDAFTAPIAGHPLELFAMAEVLLEAHMYEAGLRSAQIADVLHLRDILLRNLAKESGRRSALAVASALIDARNDDNRLELELVESFRSLGFEATKIGGQGKPDGIAYAYLSADEHGQARQYSVSLEAKSKKTDGTRVTAKTVGISTVTRHRNDFRCQHAIVVAPAFSTAQGEKSALAKEIKDDREKSEASGESRTVTLITIDDLARLVRLRPIKQIGLAELRDLFVSCSLPDDSHEWIKKIASKAVKKPPYKVIVYTIQELQIKFNKSTVEYASLRVELTHKTPPVQYDTNDELRDLCKGISQMAPGALMATDQAVELDQSPENILAMLETATKDYPIEEQESVITKRSGSR